MQLDTVIGPAAGLATSALWTATSLFFTAASKRLGPVIVNATRLALAVILLGVTHRLMFYSWLPTAAGRQVTLLALSGIVGLALGDQALFIAFVHIGPRLSMLIMSTSPLFATLFGWLVLNEHLTAITIAGMTLTISGVCWSVLERPALISTQTATLRVRGFALALFAACCQAGGLLLSKQGIGHGWLPAQEHLAPQAATLLRMIFATLAMGPVLVGTHLRFRKRRSVLPARSTAQLMPGLLFTACGAVVGPFLGVWMSLVAADRIPLGVAQTLCSLTPIFILPFAAWIHHERISARAVMGPVIAVLGIFILFFNPGAGHS